mmetsp:Transcript_22248/g.33631  ORF Transcript_22248/g.33631 Transcript_22248/m.33631 type:complete len:448 (+) Transcript_22248:3-1346(+)
MLKPKKCMMHVTSVVSSLGIVPVALAYYRQPCRSFSVRSDFSFSDCYIPQMNTELDISQASFVMAHDSGTGYIERSKALHWFYSKTQEGTAYQQLQDGARALDIRPKLLTTGEVVLQHGYVTLRNLQLETLVKDAIAWCNDNPDELVLLLTNDFQREEYNSNDDDAADDYFYLSATDAMSSVYKPLGVPYYPCETFYGLSVGDVMNLAALDGGGYLIALDRQDDYASFCAKSNWIPSELVTCYPSSSLSCLDKKTEPLESLKQYALDSANNEATDSSYALGPPADLQTYPFNEIQAMWQVDTQSAVIGLTRHASSILQDNTRSEINAAMVDVIYNEEFNSDAMLSLFAINNVALHGNAILSVLRTRCNGQSFLEVEDGICGREIRRPTMMHVNISKVAYWSIILLVSFVVLRGIWRSKGHDMKKNILNFVKSRRLPSKSVDLSTSLT